MKQFYKFINEYCRTQNDDLRTEVHKRLLYFASQEKNKHSESHTCCKTYPIAMFLGILCEQLVLKFENSDLLVLVLLTLVLL